MSYERTDALRFRGAFVVLLTLVITWAFLAMVRPFLLALLVAAVSAGLLQSPFRSLCRILGGRRRIASFLTVILLFLFIVGPLAGFLGIVVKQAVDISQSAIPWLKENLGTETDLVAMEEWITVRFPALEEFIPKREQAIEGLASLAQNAGNYLVVSVSKMTTGTATFLLLLFVMLYALFFFLLRGEELLEKICYYSPLTQEEDDRLIGRFLSVTKATIKGSLVIGVIQGGLCGIAFAVAGIPGSAFWATVMALLSVIPGLGTALVWAPATVFLAVSGEWITAILLFLWCGGVSGNLDNLLRPRLIGQDARLPDLLILLGTLGGLFLFGPIGFLVGPIICSLFVAIWEIYGETFSEYLPTVERKGADAPDSPGEAMEKAPATSAESQDTA